MNCKVLSPLLLNILPAFIILILNTILIVKVIRYNVNGTRIGRSAVIRQRPPIKKLRKSYYFIIAKISLRVFLTNIPYYTFLAYHFRKNFKENNMIEEITSIFFNLNHCTTFFI